MNRKLWLAMWTIVLIGGATSWSKAADEPSKGLNIERLKAADVNKDKKLSKSELNETLWKRLAPFDANADGELDATELAALVAAKDGTKKDTTRPGGANASFTIREHQASNGNALRYSLYVPLDAPKNLPLVLCLHGAGGNTAAANLLASPMSQKKYPCVVLAPSTGGKGARWVESTFRGNDRQRSVMPELMETLDAVVRETHADPKRIYVTGQSMGGIGTWGMIVAHPDRFAAAVPVCGHWVPEDAKSIAKVPVWAFHGANDSAVPVTGSRHMIEAMRAAGGEPKYTELPGVGHGSWDPAYATSELWEWMFKQHR